MSFLDAKSYDTLLGLPKLYEDALPRFSLSSEDIAFTRTHRRSHNRLAMAGRAAARRLSYRELIRDLKPSSISALEQLLTERGKRQRSTVLTLIH